MTRFASIAAIACALTLTGCKTTQTAAESPTGVPVPFELTFQSQRTDGRATYYELSDDRSLGFGGGRDGRYAIARPIGKITDEQARTLWELIESHGLLEMDGESFVLDWETVRYDAKITAAGASNGFTVRDSDDPGLEALEKALFKIQGDLRYGDLFRPIDEAVREGDGSVKKKQ